MVEYDIDEFLTSKVHEFVNPIKHINESTGDIIITDFIKFMMSHNKIHDELIFFLSDFCTDSEITLEILINFDPSNNDHVGTKILKKHSEETLSCLSYIFGNPVEENQQYSLLDNCRCQYMWYCDNREYDDFGMKIKITPYFIRYSDTKRSPDNDLIITYASSNYVRRNSKPLIGITKYAFLCLIKLNK